MKAPSPVGPPGAIDFTRRVLLRQVLVGLGAFGVVALLAPWSLMLESEQLPALAWLIFKVAALAIALTGLWSGWRLRTNRFVLRSLAVGSQAIEPEDIGALAELPVSLTIRYVIAWVFSALLLLVPGIRPEGLDLARAVSLSLATITIMGASAVVHFVVIRAATIRIVELSPVDPISEWLEHETRQQRPRRRMTHKILFAVVAPVALVGVGSLLVTHAHLRDFTEQSRTTTAKLLARTALEPAPGALAEAGRDEAIEAARELGFYASIQRDQEAGIELKPVRLDSGELEVQVPLVDGRAVVRYSADLAPDVVMLGVLLAAIAVLLAVALGRQLGRVLAADLIFASRQVLSLGTERVLRGQTEVAGTARFRVVARMGHSVGALADRFRLFAAAQQRTIAARKRAQRMKELLFASVSHDLKSPLSAIL